MEEIPQVKTNREALKHILLMLVGMAEMGFGRPLALVLGDAAVAPRLGRAGKTGRKKPSPALTLPRHLYRAIVRLLRPAESAARRLVIVMARGIVVVLPPVRPHKPKTRISDTVAAYRRLGLAVNLSKEDFARYQAEQKAAERRALRPRTMNLPLLDPLRMPRPWGDRARPVASLPRIMGLDFDSPFRPLPAPASSDHPVNATRLLLRLEALGRALDDLPNQAKRFARWRARRDAALARQKLADAAAARNKETGGAAQHRDAVKAGAQNREVGKAIRFRRIWPLKPGRPPGGRLRRYDPDAPRRKNIRDVDEILAHCHSMALYALERRDTS